MRIMIPVGLGIVFVLAMIGWVYIESSGPAESPKSVGHTEVIKLSHPSMRRFIAPEVIVPVGRDPDSILLIYSSDTTVYYRGIE